MIIAFISFLTFLFFVYIFSRDDFLLIRRNVAVEHIFNSIFLGLLIVLFFSRLGYVLIHVNVHYLNPFVFFIIPYFPGMSVEAGIIAAVLWILWYTKKKKYPFPRILDILSIAYLYSWAIGFLVLAIEKLIARHAFLVEIASSGVLFLIAGLITRIFLKGKWKEGKIGFVSLGFSILTIIFWHSLTFLLTKKLPLPGELLALLLVVGVTGILWTIRK